MKTSDRALSQDEVSELPTGTIVTVLWDGFKSCFWTYRVENVCGNVYCTDVKIDTKFRRTAKPLPLVDVVVKRPAPKKGTVVLGTLPKADA